MHTGIIDLVPTTEDTLLTTPKAAIRLLNLIAFIYQNIFDCSKSIVNEKFSHFDAQVSENMCQLRAYMLFSYKSEIKNEDWSGIIYSSRNKLLQCTSIKSELERYSRRTLSIPSWPITVKNFLQHNNINHMLTVFESLCVQLFILSKYKIPGDYFVSKGVDYDAIFKDSKIQSKTYIKKFIHKIQRTISYLSCQYALRTAETSNTKKMTRLLKLLYQRDEIGRHLIACYEATRSVLESTSKLDIEFKIHVFRISSEQRDEIIFYIKDNQVININHTNKTDNKPRIVFTGICNHPQRLLDSPEKYILRFLEYGLNEIILSNMAQHDQFSGRKLSAFKLNPYLNIRPRNDIAIFSEEENNFIKHKKLAQTVGCARTNMQLFYLTHVYLSDKESYVSNIIQNSNILEEVS